MSKHGFVRKTSYYTGTVYEWNLPTGSTCPFAMECLVKVDRVTGKMSSHEGAYRCYAAAAERFPAVRYHRWSNYEHVKAGNMPVIPAKCAAVRIHASGDFFNQAYFDLWLDVARQNPAVEFWAYTKSLSYWVARLDVIPGNLTLTASYGGRQDYLIAEHGLKNVIVYEHPDAVPGERPIDYNDDWARVPGVNFALLDNSRNSKKNG